MKKSVILIFSLILIGSGYLVYNSLVEEEVPIKKETLEKEFISYTLNGSVTDKSYDTLVSDYAVNSITCENGSLAEWNDTDKTIKLSSINVPDYCTIDFKEIPKPTLAEVILTDNPIVSERADFNVKNTSNTTGTIYKTNKTEDGSVRLLYAGTSHDTTEGYIGSSAFNETGSTNYIESKYAGYMYGGNTSLADNRTNTTDSTIKTYIDNWYSSYLLTDFDKYISKTAIYCNDRSVGSGTWTGNGSAFNLGPQTRIASNKSPNYKCGANASGGLFESTQATADKFSASTTGGGNGLLTYGVALMTSDEIAFAGGRYGSTLSSPYAWYYTNSIGSSITGSAYWWLISQSDYYSKASSGSYYIRVFSVNASSEPGDFSRGKPIYFRHVRPVISIDSCAKFTGSGTSTDPYVIDETNSSC